VSAHEIIGLAISIGGGVISIVVAALVAWAKLAAIDAKQETRLEGFRELFTEVVKRQDEKLGEVAEETAIHSARIEVQGSKLAVLESQVGSLRAMRAPGWKRGNES